MKTVAHDLARLIGAQPSFLRFAKNYLIHRGFRAVVLYRLAHWLSTKRIDLAAKLVTSHCLSKTGADIQPMAEIGPGLVIKHPVGVTIGCGCRIGQDFTVLQGVTLGEKCSINGHHRYPTIGDGVTIYAGAKVLGGVGIGSGSVVGANAVVIHDVPANTVVAGVPAREIRGLEQACSQTRCAKPGMIGLAHS